MVQVLVLGPIGVTRPDGRPLRLGSPLVQRLIGALATEAGRPIGRDRLIEVLWGDSPPEGATNNLHVYVSRLRNELGRDAIETSSVGYALSVSVELDAAAFERCLDHARSADLAQALSSYDEALALWRGPVFGAFADEWWARLSASRLAELRLAAMGERIEVLLALGDVGRAVADSELLLAADALKEPSVLLRMRALHMAGRSADALRVAAAFRRRLSDQVGLSPSPALDELEQQILEHDPAATRSALTRALRGYVFGELLAEGAHGAVYAASQPSLGREVAIKVLRKDRADAPEFIRRFEAEAQFVARLEHPSIVPLYDYWREPGNAYLVFRLLRGGSLAQRIVRRESIPIDEIDLLVERIGDALSSAHGRGVVHRDVRAANVLYDDEGRPYLSDFSIALAEGSVDDAADDVAALAAMLLPLVGEHSSLAEQRSLLRRAATGEIVTARELVMTWRASRELVTPTPTPDRAHHRRSAAVANPYVGLRTFDEADAALFFGRDTPVAEIVELIRQRPFVTVVGPSGAGKSSVVRAGVIPQLRAQSCLVTTMTPGARPLYSLGVALRRIATEAQLAAAGDDAARLLGEVAGAQPTVLVIDQLEELWTQSVPHDRVHLIKVLDEAISNARLRVISTIRADFYDRPLDEPLLAPLVQKGNYSLTALGAAELEASISGPLATTGVSVEAGLVAQIVVDVTGRPAPLPLMQYALSSLYDRRTSNVLTLDAYRAIGGVAGAIASAAEELYQQLNPTQQDQCRELFANLVTPGEASSDDTRRRALRSELADIDAELIERLNQLRLLTFDRDASTGEPTVEIAHEALLTHWPRLRQWTDDQRDQLRIRRALREDAAAWELASHSGEHLYRPARLATALERVGLARLTPREQSFLDASIEQRDREASRERRRLRRAQTLLAATAGLLIVTLIAGGLALAQRQRADRRADEATAARDEATTARDEADIARLVAQSRADAKSDPSRAMLLAVEAYKREPSWRTAGAVQSALVQQPQGVLAYLSGDGPFESIEYGKRVIVARDGVSLAVWSAADYRRLSTTKDDGTADGAIALSSDDKVVAVAGPSGLYLYDIGTGAQLKKVSYPSVATVAAFDPTDPERLAVGHIDGSVEIVRWRNDQTDLRLPSHKARVGNISFSASGSLVATSGRDRRAGVFDAHTGATRAEVQFEPGGSPDFVTSLSPNGNYLVGYGSVAGRPDVLRVWRVADSTLQFEWSSPRAATEYPSSAVIVDDSTIYATALAGPLRRFDLQAKAEVPAPFFEGGSLLNDTAASPDGRAVAIGAQTGITIQALDGRRLGAALSLELPRLTPQTAVIAAASTSTFSFDTDATHLLAHYGLSYLYDLTTEPPTYRPLDFATGPAWRAQFTDDGKLIETIHASQTGSTYQRWDPTTLAPVGNPVKLPGWAHNFSSNPDGRFVAANNLWDSAVPTSVVRIYDIQTGLIVHELDDLDHVRGPRFTDVIQFASSFSFSHDSRFLAASEAGGPLVVWDLTTGKPVASQPRSIRFVDFDLKGRLLTVNANGEILLSDIGTGEMVQSMDGRSLASNRPAINPNPLHSLFKTDNHCVAPTIGVADTQLWDLDAGVEIGVGFPFTCSSWSPDGRLFAGNYNTDLYIWSIDHAKWAEAACRAAGRNLTEAEWRTYVSKTEPRRDTCP